jgi:hypothetical protein
MERIASGWPECCQAAARSLRCARRARHVGLAVDQLAALGARVHGHVRQRRRQDKAPDCKDAAGLAHGLFEVARYAGHRGDEQVAEAVSFQAGAFVEAVLEQARHQRLRLGQRRDAVAQVTRR